jgi:hypothetical protein
LPSPDIVSVPLKGIPTLRPLAGADAGIDERNLAANPPYFVVIVALAPGFSWGISEPGMQL